MKPLLSLSIVSHRQAELIRPLLANLACCGLADFEVLLTINLPEDESAYADHPFPVRIIRNPVPKGFGANHNAAFAASAGRWFVIVNPDIRIDALDVAALLAPFDDPSTGAVAPTILSVRGTVEDSVRRFPTLGRLSRRVLLRQREPDYTWQREPISVDWVAGMFVVFRREAFEQVSGFDDKRFFMYFEDVDICARLAQRGWTIRLQPQVAVVHDAQRDSHRNWRHLRWHLVSALRYLIGL